MTAKVTTIKIQKNVRGAQKIDMEHIKQNRLCRLVTVMSVVCVWWNESWRELCCL